MSRNSKLISKNLKEEIAKELGVYEQVKKMEDGKMYHQEHVVI